MEHQLKVEQSDYQNKGCVFPSLKVPVGGRRVECLITVGALPSSEKIPTYARLVPHLVLTQPLSLVSFAILIT